MATFSAPRSSSTLPSQNLPPSTLDTDERSWRCFLFHPTTLSRVQGRPTPLSRLYGVRWSFLLSATGCSTLIVAQCPPLVHRLGVYLYTFGSIHCLYSLAVQTLVHTYLQSDYLRTVVYTFRLFYRLHYSLVFFCLHLCLVALT